MAVTSSEVVDSEHDFDFDTERGTPRELISSLKFSFRDSDFAKVESILVAREAKLKVELETTRAANEWLKERLEFGAMEKYRVGGKCLELQQLNSQLNREKNIIYEKQRKAENEAEIWRNKYQQLESRILKLEADTKLLLNVDSEELNVRVFDKNGKDVELENGKVNGDCTCDGGEGPTSRYIFEIIDGNDDCAPGEILRKNEMTSPRVPNSVRSGQTGVQSGTGMLKRKLDSCLNVSENKTCNNGDNVGNSSTADCKIEKLQKLLHEEDCSPVRHCTVVAISPRSTDVEKFCIPSSQEPVVLRQCEEMMGWEHTSQNLRRGFPLGLPAAYDIENSSSSSSSSSDSDDDMDLNFDFSQLIGPRNDKKWELEADMLAAFEKDNELYLQAVCALYRQRKSSWSFSSTNNRGFNPFNANRGTTLAKFLIDGDPQGNLRKSLSELLQHDIKGLDDCKKLAIEHSKQLFEIYQRKEDPLFSSYIGCTSIL